MHTYHTVYEEYTHYFSPSQRWGRAAARCFTRHIAARCDALIAPTAKVAALLNGYGVACPVATLPTGIETARFANPDPKAVAALRRRLRLPEGRPVLLYLGRLAREKNVEELFAVAAALGETATLLLVGDGPDRMRLETLAAGLPNVVFAAWPGPIPCRSTMRWAIFLFRLPQAKPRGLPTAKRLRPGCRLSAGPMPA